MEYYSVKEMAQLRNVSEQAIYKQLSAHRAATDGHKKKINGRTCYDETVLQLFQDYAQQAAPVIVQTENAAAKDAEIAALKERIAALESIQADNAATIKALTEDNLKQRELADNAKLLLADKQRLEEQKEEQQQQIVELSKETASQGEQIRQQEQQLHENEVRINELQTDIDAKAQLLADRERDLTNVRGMGWLAFRKWKKNK